MNQKKQCPRCGERKIAYILTSDFLGKYQCEGCGFKAEYGL